MRKTRWVTSGNPPPNQVGEDVKVEDRVLLELKAQKTLHPSSEAQIINYLKVTGLNIGLLINFTWPKATVKRIAL